MSRLKFRIGDHVKLDGQEFALIVKLVNPTFNCPYLLSDGMWRPESSLIPYVLPILAWTEVEVYVQRIVEDLRQVFKDNNESYLRFEIKATGRLDGNIKIKYLVSDDSYDGTTTVEGYSLRPALDEMFRRKMWKKRNEPLAITNNSFDGDPV